MAARVTLRQLAINDADAAFDNLLAEAPPGTAANFVEALQQALDHLSQHPLTGSLRFAFELDIPELRTWSLNRFPYLIFYVCTNNDVDVWRILHAHATFPHLSETMGLLLGDSARRNRWYDFAPTAGIEPTA